MPSSEDPDTVATGRSVPPEGARERPLPHPWLRLLRLHHWIKNALLAVPLLTAQAWHQPAAWWAVFCGIGAFSLVASATYVLNDLNDIEADRRHREKRFRPLAARQIRPRTALIVAGLLIVGGGCAAFGVGRGFAAVTLLYIVITVAYTRYLKRVALLDVLALATLWALRVLAGAVAIGVDLSVWLLSFAAFLFLSLSLLKRCAELREASGEDDASLPGRSYQRRDLAVLQVFGIATGTVSVLVLALFVDSPSAISHYPHPERLWLMCPAIWFWLGRLWLETGRGHMHHDPVVFSLRDPPSWCALGVVATAFAASVAPF